MPIYALGMAERTPVLQACKVRQRTKACRKTMKSESPFRVDSVLGGAQMITSRLR